MAQHVHDVDLYWDEDGLYLVMNDDEGNDYLFNVHGVVEKLYSKIREEAAPYIIEKQKAETLYNAHVRMGYKWTEAGWVPDEDE